MTIWKWALRLVSEMDAQTVGSLLLSPGDSAWKVEDIVEPNDEERAAGAAVRFESSVFVAQLSMKPNVKSICSHRRSSCCTEFTSSD